MGVPNCYKLDEGQRRRRRNWANAAGGLPGVLEHDTSTQNAQRKLGSSRGQPRRTRTAKAPRISRQTMKLRCAHERGGWGRISVDGPGHYNPDRSEGPWGRAAHAARTAVLHPSASLDTERGKAAGLESTKGADKPREAKGMPGVGSTGVACGQVPPDKLALEPYWGKPAVRNLRGAGGNGATVGATRARSWKRRTPTSADLQPPRLLPTRQPKRMYFRPSGVRFVDH
jgi:hypothetical protein